MRTDEKQHKRIPPLHEVSTSVLQRFHQFGPPAVGREHHAAGKARQRRPLCRAASRAFPGDPGRCHSPVTRPTHPSVSPKTSPRFWGSQGSAGPAPAPSTDSQGSF